jgi:hypothetical protein
MQGMRRQFVRFATALEVARDVGLAALAVARDLGLAGLRLASRTAQAHPGLAPLYHCRPGDDWLPWCGFNFDLFTCHNDPHRDIDGDDRSRDCGGDQGGPAPRQPGN